MALDDWPSCSRSRVDSCCPAADGVLHCLQGAFRGSTAAWPHPSGMLFRQCICWTSLSYWQTWLWHPHRRGQCDQVGLQGQVWLHDGLWGVAFASAHVSSPSPDARELSGEASKGRTCVMWHPISTALSCHRRTAAATQQAGMSACRLCGGLECACQRSVAPAGPGPPQQGMS